MNYIYLPLAILLLLASGCGPNTRKSESNPTEASDLEFNPRVIVPDPFPVIEKPPLAQIGEAPSYLAEEDLVLGLSIGGQHRAYPVAALESPRREIVNDELGGVPIAATW